MRPQPFTIKAITVGDHGLELRWVEVLSPYLQPGHKGYDFHSLTWVIRTGGGWEDHFEIRREEFQRGAPRRWISELHGFDPVAGTALLVIGEERPGDTPGVIAKAEYSWREWDLLHNRLLRVIRACEWGGAFGPFEVK